MTKKKKSDEYIAVFVLAVKVDILDYLKKAAMKSLRKPVVQNGPAARWAMEQWYDHLIECEDKEKGTP